MHLKVEVASRELDSAAERRDRLPLWDRQACLSSSTAAHCRSVQGSCRLHLTGINGGWTVFIFTNRSCFGCASRGLEFFHCLGYSLTFRVIVNSGEGANTIVFHTLHGPWRGNRVAVSRSQEDRAGKKYIRNRSFCSFGCHLLGPFHF